MCSYYIHANVCNKTTKIQGGQHAHDTISIGTRWMWRIPLYHMIPGISFPLIGRIVSRKDSVG